MNDLILAIDPGTEKSAFVVFDQNERSVIDKGICVNDGIINYILDHNESPIAIEMVASYGMPVGREVFETVLWIGRFMQTAHWSLQTPTLIYRKDVKMHLCGSVRAKDANIRQALIDLLGKEKTTGVSKDMWAALGVAVTVAGIQ